VEEIRFPQPPIAGPGFVLRPFRPADYPAVSATREHPETAPWVNALADPDAATMASAVEAARRAGRLLYLIAAAPDSDDYLGEILFFRRTDEVAEAAAGEIAYTVAPAARGRGIATNAVRRLSRWAFRELGVERLQLSVHPDNLASHRVAQKAGYTREGLVRSVKLIRGERIDAVRYSALPGEIPDEDGP
jgi:RimJ/RimL family protein N-acetyltransferase